ncbi:MAG: type II toxin-antitoxin system death-on-curing family toxin [Deltaproteobacteria bacterium]|nr:MAG: type II toxin-antitoxin system death-on-curing family toxin [Deltaproteobacteria bacterium]
MAIHFVPDDLVLIIHADQLKRYGGKPGLRDRSLLESALAQPRITVGGKFAHRTLFEKAAAYGFHLCKNHPFVDGNKRVAFVLMDIFLQKNGWEILAHEKEAYSMMIDLASGKLTKVQLASWLKEHSSRIPRR